MPIPFPPAFRSKAIFYRMSLILIPFTMFLPRMPGNGKVQRITKLHRLAQFLQAVIDAVQKAVILSPLFRAGDFAVMTGKSRVVPSCL